MRDINDVLNSLTYQTVSPEVSNNMANLRDFAKEVAHSIETLVPDGRCKAVAYTKLEECVMWALKGMCCDNQPEEDS